jgi:hypothetical protein
MSNPYRAMIAQLAAALQQQVFLDPEIDGNHLPRLAEALLAQPEPVAPTDEELIEPIMWMIDEHVYDTDKGEIAESLRELLARWGTPAIQPVPGVEGADE